MDLGFSVVPLIATLSELPTTIPDLLAMADGTSALCRTPREGLVFRYYKNGGLKHSFKAISNKFLLKEKD